MTNTVNVHRLPPAFAEDRDGRDLPTGIFAAHTTSMSLDDALEYLSDAEYYASRYGPDVGIGLKSSARASVKALRAALLTYRDGCSWGPEYVPTCNRINAALGEAEAADAAYEAGVVQQIAPDGYDDFTRRVKGLSPSGRRK